MNYLYYLLAALTNKHVVRAYIATFGIGWSILEWSYVQYGNALILGVVSTLVLIYANEGVKE